MFDLSSLFFSAFISSTLFPGGSELLLIYYLTQHPEHALSYFIAVTVGNTLGAMVTYVMGYYLDWKRSDTQQKHPKIWQWAKQKGSWALLLSWLPVIGDLLPLMAGWLKIPFSKAIFMILIGKALRYGAIILFFSELASGL